MSEGLVLLDPTSGEAGIQPVRLAPRAAVLDGLVLGILDNGKPKSDRLLRRLQERLERRHAFREVLWARKPAIGRLAPGAMVDDLAARCHVIITGVGD